MRDRTPWKISDADAAARDEQVARAFVAEVKALQARGIDDREVALRMQARGWSAPGILAVTETAVRVRRDGP